MMIEELAPVVLTKPLPEHGLETGDVGTVVHRYEHGDAYEVEFLTGDGRTVAVLTLERSDIRPPAEGEIFHTRQVEV